MSDLPVANKSLGQHWLTDQNALQAICDAGEITNRDIVLEIGPGTGTLTRLLVQHARQVVAVEFDQKLALELPQQVGTNNLSVWQQDILTFDFSDLPIDYKVVANIPYYLTSNLIRVLSETTNRATLVVLLVQKEVAQRVAAEPGKMSLLSVSAQFYWQVSLGVLVKAKLFTPPPKIDSQVLVLKRRVKPLYPNMDTKRFFRIVKAAFAARRKTLLNSLSGGLRISREEAKRIIDSAALSPAQRSQELSMNDWVHLYQAYSALNNT